MIHEFEIKTKTLSQVVGIVQSLVDEVRVKINNEGWEMRATDPAQVAMFKANIDKKAFYTYDYKKESEIGVDVDKLKALLKLCDWYDITTFKGKVIEEGKMGYPDLIVQIGNLKRLIVGISPDGLRWDKLPKLELPIKREVEVKDLQFGLRNAQEISDHVTLIADKEGFRLRADGDMDYVEIPLNSEGSEETHRSLFSIDYFLNFVKPIHMESVYLTIGTDYPLIMDYNSNGISVKILLAPRIESE